MDGEPQNSAGTSRPPTIYEIPYLRLFPWLRLFRVPGAAADPKRMMLAALGLVLLHLGWDGLDQAFPRSRGITPDVLDGWPAVAWSRPGEVLTRVAEPARILTAPFRRLLSLEHAPRPMTHAGLSALWAVLVWGLIGGAIARIAAVDVARSERVSMKESLGFAFRKAIPLVGTPLLPFSGLVLVGSLIAGFGLLYRVPGNVGSVAAGAMAFLPLVGGLVLTLIVIGVAAGWPLVHASVAVEAEDSFDAMSRSFAYVYQRPWLYAAFAAMAAVLMGLGLWFVDAFARLVTHMAAWALAFGAPGSTISALYADGPAVVPPAAITTHGFWLSLVGILVQGWIWSAFWTAATVIYLLLRKDVDGTPIGRIAARPKVNALLDAVIEAAATSPVAATSQRAEPASAVPAPHSHLRDPGEAEAV